MHLSFAMPDHMPIYSFIFYNLTFGKRVGNVSKTFINFFYVEKWFELYIFLIIKPIKSAYPHKTNIKVASFKTCMRGWDGCKNPMCSARMAPWHPLTHSA